MKLPIDRKSVLWALVRFYKSNQTDSDERRMKSHSDNWQMAI